MMLSLRPGIRYDWQTAADRTMFIEVFGDSVQVAVDPPEPVDQEAIYNQASTNRSEIVRIEKRGGVFPPVSGESTYESALRHEFPRRD